MGVMGLKVVRRREWVGGMGGMGRRGVGWEDGWWGSAGGIAFGCRCWWCCLVVGVPTPIDQGEGQGGSAFLEHAALGM